MVTRETHWYVDSLGVSMAVTKELAV